MSTVILSVLASVGSSTLLWFLFRKLVDTQLTKEINRHKSELDQHSEVIKYNLQRQMLHADVFTKIMHEVYPEIARRLRRAYTDIANIKGLKFVPDWGNMPIDEIEFQLKNLQDLHEREAIKLLEEVERDKTKGIGSIEKALGNVEKKRARKSLAEAKNYILEHPLYISNEVSSSTNGILANLTSAYYDYTFEDLGPGAVAKGFKIINEMASDLEKLEILMKKEIAPKEPIG